ncbi:hypothetical protein Lal_00023540, partial [Lupinus albus]
ILSITEEGNYIEILRVLLQGSSTNGESGPKIRPKGIVDGQHVNIPVLLLVGPEERRRLDGYWFKDARCPCFFSVRRGRENASSQCSSTRCYGAEVTHAILSRKARTTFNKRVPVPETDTGEPATEAPVNGGRNYNGPKVSAISNNEEEPDSCNR